MKIIRYEALIEYALILINECGMSTIEVTADVIEAYNLREDQIEIFERSLDLARDLAHVAP